MGHGSNDKLYITHAEHSGGLGQHSASSGYKVKQQASHPGNRTPFDCCALSFQPFEHPVCARNEDGTGTVFELVNIIPWLKQHNNTNPVNGNPLTPDGLLTLNYFRKPTGQIHDPISFKPFSEHSHIVAIASTGNVFLAESIKGNKDLIAEVAFKKQDIITLQNPHALMTTAPQPTPSSSKAAVPQPNQSVATLKKEAKPWNASPFSTGLPGASLTSTSVDPQLATSTLLWDEEELMFDEFINPPKGKGKERDVGRRRAYVRVVVSGLGGTDTGRSLNLELYCEKAPKTCYNFLMLSRQGKYDNVLFHRLVPDFMIQTGDPTGTGVGGESYWGKPFRDEYDVKGAAKHDSRGILSMANKGKDTNGSQWFLTFQDTPNLDKKHTVFGKLVGGEDVLDALEKLPRKPNTERPAKAVRIQEVIIYQDPFEAYKERHAKKLARQAEKGRPTTIDDKKAGDDVNWFGVKLGDDDQAVSRVKLGMPAGGGVGKYLSQLSAPAPKRPLEKKNGFGVGADDDAKKKRKLGFGSFDGW